MVGDGGGGRSEAPPTEQRSRAQETRERLPAWAVQALQLFALCGFAFAQPIFDLLGNNATFFVAHDTTGWRIVLFTMLLLVGPPLVLFGVLRLLHLLVPTVDRVAMAVVVGGLVALFVVPAIDRSAHLTAEVYGIVGLVLWAGCGVAYYHWRVIRLFATYLSPAPLLFAAVFLFTSPVNALLSSDEPTAIGGLEGMHGPVVVIIFDELPLGALVDESGRLDAARYPGFASLANGSTWYPRATTVAPWTNLAVPAIQSGRLPEWGTLPFASSYPRSLFTMLGSAYELHVNEAVTRNCPRALCEGSGTNAERDADLSKDTAIAYLHTVLPASLEDRWLPYIGNSWAGFGEDVEDATAIAEQEVRDAEEWIRERRAGADRASAPRLFGEFLESITGPPRPALWYQHVLSPHVPFAYLPDGRTYEGGRMTGLESDGVTWRTDPDLLDVARQQFLLQVSYIDALVGETVDRLKEEGLWEDAFVAVVADHGLSFEPGRHRRGVPLDEASVDEVLPVPLFVKYPGQKQGAIDERPVQTIDVLPTIVDAFDLRLPRGWRFDGVSLLDDTVRDRKLVYMDSEEGSLRGGERRTANGRARPERMAARMRAPFGTTGDGLDLYRLGPYGDLLGQDVAALAPIDSPNAAVVLDDPDAYRRVRPKDGTIPAFLGATVEGLTSDDWVAVALNGTIAGFGPVYEDGDTLRVAAMLEPSRLRAGANEVEVYVVRDDGSRLERLRPGS